MAVSDYVSSQLVSDLRPTNHSLGSAISAFAPICILSSAPAPNPRAQVREPVGLLAQRGFAARPLRGEGSSTTTNQLRVQEGPLPYLLMPAVGQAEGSNISGRHRGYESWPCGRIDIILHTQGEIRLRLSAVPGKQLQLEPCSS